MLIVGDTPLKGTEDPFSQADNESQEVCCLLGAKIRDIAKRVLQLIKIMDYNPLLLFHDSMKLEDSMWAESKNSVKLWEHN